MVTLAPLSFSSENVSHLRVGLYLCSRLGHSALSPVGHQDIVQIQNTSTNPVHKTNKLSNAVDYRAVVKTRDECS